MVKLLQASSNLEFIDQEIKYQIIDQTNYKSTQEFSEAMLTLKFFFN